MAQEEDQNQPNQDHSNQNISVETVQVNIDPNRISIDDDTVTQADLILGKKNHLQRLMDGEATEGEREEEEGGGEATSIGALAKSVAMGDISQLSEEGEISFAEDILVDEREGAEAQTLEQAEANRSQNLASETQTGQINSQGNLFNSARQSENAGGQDSSGAGNTSETDEGTQGDEDSEGDQQEQEDNEEGANRQNVAGLTDPSQINLAQATDASTLSETSPAAGQSNPSSPGTSSAAEDTKQTSTAFDESQSEDSGGKKTTDEVKGDLEEEKAEEKAEEEVKAEEEEQKEEEQKEEEQKEEEQKEEEQKEEEEREKQEEEQSEQDFIEEKPDNVSEVFQFIKDNKIDLKEAGEYLSEFTSVNSSLGTQYAKLFNTGLLKASEAAFVVNEVENGSFTRTHAEELIVLTDENVIGPETLIVVANFFTKPDLDIPVADTFLGLIGSQAISEDLAQNLASKTQNANTFEILNKFFFLSISDTITDNPFIKTLENIGDNKFSFSMLEKMTNAINLGNANGEALDILNTLLAENVISPAQAAKFINKAEQNAAFTEAPARLLDFVENNGIGIQDATQLLENINLNDITKSVAESIVLQTINGDLSVQDALSFSGDIPASGVGFEVLHVLLEYNGEEFVKDGTITKLVGLAANGFLSAEQLTDIVLSAANQAIPAELGAVLLDLSAGQFISPQDSTGIAGQIILAGGATPAVETVFVSLETLDVSPLTASRLIAVEFEGRPYDGSVEQFLDYITSSSSEEDIEQILILLETLAADAATANRVISEDLAELIGDNTDGSFATFTDLVTFTTQGAISADALNDLTLSKASESIEFDAASLRTVRDFIETKVIEGSISSEFVNNFAEGLLAENFSALEALEMLERITLDQATESDIQTFFIIASGTEPYEGAIEDALLAIENGNDGNVIADLLLNISSGGISANLAKNILVHLQAETGNSPTYNKLVGHVADGFISDSAANSLSLAVQNNADFTFADLDTVNLFIETDIESGPVPTSFMDNFTSVLTNNTLTAEQAMASLALISDNKASFGDVELLFDVVAGGDLTSEETDKFIGFTENNILSGGELNSVLTVLHNGLPHVDALSDLITIIESNESDASAAVNLLQTNTSAAISEELSDKLFDTVINHAMTPDQAENLSVFVDSVDVNPGTASLWLDLHRVGKIDLVQNDDLLSRIPGGLKYDGILNDFMTLLDGTARSASDMLNIWDAVDNANIAEAISERIFNLLGQSVFTVNEIGAFANEVGTTDILNPDAERILDALDSYGEPYDNALGNYVSLVTSDKATGGEIADIFELVSDPAVNTSAAEKIYLEIDSGDGGFNPTTAYKLALSVKTLNVSNGNAEILLDNLGGNLDDADLDRIIDVADQGEPYSGAINQFTGYIDIQGNSSEIVDLLEILANDANSGSRKIDEALAESIADNVGTDFETMTELAGDVISGDIYTTTLENIVTARATGGNNFGSTEIQSLETFVDTHESTGQVFKDFLENWSQALASGGLDGGRAMTLLSLTPSESSFLTGQNLTAELGNGITLSQYDKVISFIDTEGPDPSVMEGITNALAADKITGESLDILIDIIDANIVNAEAVRDLTGQINPGGTQDIPSDNLNDFLTLVRDTGLNLADINDFIAGALQSGNGDQLLNGVMDSAQAGDITDTLAAHLFEQSLGPDNLNFNSTIKMLGKIGIDFDEADIQAIADFSENLSGTFDVTALLSALIDSVDNNDLESQHILEILDFVENQSDLTVADAETLLTGNSGGPMVLFSSLKDLLNLANSDLDAADTARILKTVSNGNLSDSDIVKLVNAANLGEPYADAFEEFMNLVDTANGIDGAEASSILEKLSDTDVEGGTAEAIHDTLSSGEGGFNEADALRVATMNADQTIDTPTADALLNALSHGLDSAGLNQLLNISETPGEKFQDVLKDAADMITGGSIAGDVIDFVNTLHDPGITDGPAERIFDAWQSSTLPPYEFNLIANEALADHISDEKAADLGEYSLTGNNFSVADLGSAATVINAIVSGEGVPKSFIDKWSDALTSNSINNFNSDALQPLQAIQNQSDVDYTHIETILDIQTIQGTLYGSGYESFNDYMDRITDNTLTGQQAADIYAQLSDDDVGPATAEALHEKLETGAGGFDGQPALKFATSVANGNIDNPNALSLLNELGTNLTSGELDRITDIADSPGGFPYGAALPDLLNKITGGTAASSDDDITILEKLANPVYNEAQAATIYNGFTGSSNALNFSATVQTAINGNMYAQDVADLVVAANTGGNGVSQNGMRDIATFADDLNNPAAMADFMDAFIDQGLGAEAVTLVQKASIGGLDGAEQTHLPNFFADLATGQISNNAITKLVDAYNTDNITPAQLSNISEQFKHPNVDGTTENAIAGAIRDYSLNPWQGGTLAELLANNTPGINSANIQTMAGAKSDPQVQYDQIQAFIDSANAGEPYSGALTHYANFMAANPTSLDETDDMATLLTTLTTDANSGTREIMPADAQTIFQNGSGFGDDIDRVTTLVDSAIAGKTTSSVVADLVQAASDGSNAYNIGTLQISTTTINNIHTDVTDAFLEKWADAVVNQNIPGNIGVNANPMLEVIQQPDVTQAHVETLIDIHLGNTPGLNAPYGDSINEFIDLIENNTLTGQEAADIYTQLANANISEPNAELIHDKIADLTIDGTDALRLTTLGAGGDLPANALTRLLNTANIAGDSTNLNDWLDFAENVGERFTDAIFDALNNATEDPYEGHYLELLYDTHDTGVFPDTADAEKFFDAAVSVKPDLSKYLSLLSEAVEGNISGDKAAGLTDILNADEINSVGSAIDAIVTSDGASKAFIDKWAGAVIDGYVLNAADSAINLLTVIQQTDVIPAQIETLLDFQIADNKPYGTDDEALNEFIALVNNNTLTGHEAADIYTQLVDSDVGPATAEAIHDALAATDTNDRLSPQGALDLASVVADSTNTVIDNTFAQDLLNALTQVTFRDDDIRKIIYVAKEGEPYPGAAEDFFNYMSSEMGAGVVAVDRIGDLLVDLTDSLTAQETGSVNDLNAIQLAEIGNALNSVYLTNSASAEFSELINEMQAGKISPDAMTNLFVTYDQDNGNTFLHGDLAQVNSFLDSQTPGTELTSMMDSVAQALVQNDINGAQATAMLDLVTNNDATFIQIDELAGYFNGTKPYTDAIGEFITLIDNASDTAIAEDIVNLYALLQDADISEAAAEALHNMYVNPGISLQNALDLATMAADENNPRITSEVIIDIAAARNNNMDNTLLDQFMTVANSGTEPYTGALIEIADLLGSATSFANATAYIDILNDLGDAAISAAEGQAIVTAMKDGHFGNHTEVASFTQALIDGGGAPYGTFVDDVVNALSTNSYFDGTDADHFVLGVTAVQTSTQLNQGDIENLVHILTNGDANEVQTIIRLASYLDDGGRGTDAMDFVKTFSSDLRNGEFGDSATALEIANTLGDINGETMNNSFYPDIVANSFTLPYPGALTAVGSIDPLVMDNSQKAEFFEKMYDPNITETEAQSILGLAVQPDIDGSDLVVMITDVANDTVQNIDFAGMNEVILDKPGAGSTSQVYDIDNFSVNSSTVVRFESYAEMNIDVYRMELLDAGNNVLHTINLPTPGATQWDEVTVDLGTHFTGEVVSMRLFMDDNFSKSGRIRNFEVFANNPPTVTSADMFAVSEDQISGLSVFTVTADDIDSASVVYAVTGGSGSGLFTIDSATGVITLDGSLDAETQNVFTLEVDISDGINTVTETLTINIDDVNEFSPAIQTGQTFDIDENIAAGASVGTVIADDNDLTDSISFAISGGNTDGAFDIDVNTGEITTLTELDFENIGSYTLTIEVTDGTNTTTETVDVTVNDTLDIPSNIETLIIGGETTQGHIDAVSGFETVAGDLGLSQKILDNLAEQTLSVDTVNTLTSAYGSTITSSGLNSILSFIENYEDTATSGLINVTQIEASMAGLQYSTDTGNFYLYVSAPADQDAAETNAASLDIAGETGFLATITTIEENDFISGIAGSNYIFVGGNYNQAEDAFSWSYGPEAGQEIIFINWDGGTAPAAPADGESIFIQPDGTWDVGDTFALASHYVVEFDGDAIFANLHDAMSNVAFATILIEDVAAGSLDEAAAEEFINLIDNHNLNSNIAADILQKTQTGRISYGNINIFMNMVATLSVSTAAAVLMMEKVFAGEIDIENMNFMIEYANASSGSETIFDNVVNFIDQNDGANEVENAGLIRSLFALDKDAGTDPHVDGFTVENIIRLIDSTALTVDEAQDMADQIEYGRLEGETLDNMILHVDSGVFSDGEAVALIRAIADGGLNATSANKLLSLYNDSTLTDLQAGRLIMMADAGNESANAIIDALHGGNIGLETAMAMESVVTSGNLDNTQVENILQKVENGILAGGQLDGLTQFYSTSVITDVEYSAILDAIDNNIITPDYFSKLAALTASGGSGEALTAKIIQSFAAGEINALSSEPIMDMALSEATWIDNADDLITAYINDVSADGYVYARLAQEIMQQTQLSDGEVDNLTVSIEGGFIYESTALRLLMKLNNNTMSPAQVSSIINDASSQAQGPAAIDANVADVNAFNNQLNTDLSALTDSVTANDIMIQINSEGLLDQNTVTDLINSGFGMPAKVALVSDLANGTLNPVLFENIMALNSDGTLEDQTVDNIMQLQETGNLAYENINMFAEYVGNLQMSDTVFNKILSAMDSGNLNESTAMDIGYQITQNGLNNTQNNAVLDKIETEDLDEIYALDIFEAAGQGGLNSNSVLDLTDFLIAGTLSDTTLQGTMYLVSEGELDGNTLNSVFTMVDNAQLTAERAVHFMDHIVNGKLSATDAVSLINSFNSSNINADGLGDFIDGLENGNIDPSNAHEMIYVIESATVSDASFETLFDLIDNQNSLDDDTAADLMSEVAEGDINTASVEALISDVNDGNISQQSAEFVIDSIVTGHTIQQEINTLLANINSEVNTALEQIANAQEPAIQADWTQEVKDMVSDFAQINDPLSGNLPDPDGDTFALDIPDENMDDITGNVL